MGRVESREKASTMSKSQDKQRRQLSSDRSKKGTANSVKQLGNCQRAKTSSARDEGKPDVDRTAL